MLAVMSAAVFTGCGGEKKEEAAPAAGGKIVVISREDAAAPAAHSLNFSALKRKVTTAKS